MPKPTAEEIKAALIAEHAPDGPPPASGGAWERVDGTLVRVEPDAAPAAAASTTQDEE